MKKIIVIISTMLLASCDAINDNQTRYVGNNITEICIDGVVYLTYSVGGITPKINADHYPHICNVKNTDIPK
ncbi:hypothetical protein [Pasteurella multocida]|uniref:hypothetical protein n=1 Tax=Pasteurella multocida TaxID=747 RepID=UPI0038FCEBDB